MNKELIKSFLIYGLTSGLSKFVPLLLIPIYTRVFSPADYGTMDVIQSIVLILTIFGTLQLETSIQRYYYEFNEKLRKKMIATVLIAVSVLSILLCIITFLFATLLSEILFSTEIYKTEILVASFIIPFLNISTVNFIVLRYLKKPFLFGFLTFLQVVITALATVLLVLYYKLGISSVFWGQLAGFFLITVIQFYFIRNHIIICWSPKLLKKMLSFALPQFPARIGSTSNAYINRFFMIGMLSATSIGLFSVALKFASIMQLVLSAFLMSWIPFMYENLKKNNHKTIFKNIFNIVIYLSGAFIILISLFSKEILVLFTTKKFFEAYYLLPGLIFYYGLFIVKGVVDIGPMISKRMIYSSYSYFISSVINIFLIYLFVKFFGLKGVVYALIFTNIFLVILCWYYSEKLYPIFFSKRIFLFYILILFPLILLLMNFDVNLLFRISLSILIIVASLFYIKKIKLNE